MGRGWEKEVVVNLQSDCIHIRFWGDSFVFSFDFIFYFFLKQERQTNLLVSFCFLSFFFFS